jgi:hypothetical protein
MTNPNIQIGDQIRPMTDAEYAQWQADQAETETKAETEAEKLAARQAVLDKLGLTADEVAALLS